MTGQAFIALLPELIATGFLILVLMAGVFSGRVWVLDAVVSPAEMVDDVD